jgi:hypothetical protein
MFDNLNISLYDNGITQRRVIKMSKANWRSPIKTYAIYVNQQDYAKGVIQSYGINLTVGQLEWLKECGQVVILVKQEIL